VKSYIVDTWWRIDFCSKFAVHVGDENGFEGYYLFRDPLKMLTTKNYYHGTNQAIRNDP